MNHDDAEPIEDGEQRFRDAVAKVQARVGLEPTGDWDASVEAAVLMHEADLAIMAEEADNFIPPDSPED